MHKRTSTRTGGSALSGWSTAKATTPTDYRTLKRWRDERKKKNRKSRYERETRKFRTLLLKLAGEGKPPPVEIPPILQAEVAEAGGVVEWAVQQSRQLKPVGKRAFLRSGSRPVQSRSA